MALVVMGAEADDFLERRLGEGSGRRYRSVVRGKTVPQRVGVWSAPKVRRGLVVRWEEEPVAKVVPLQSEREVAPEIARKAAPEGTGVPEAWWGFLRWPWSGAWRWVLGIGAAVCVALGLATLAAPEMHWLYTVAMAACVPVAVVTLFCELEVSRRVNVGVAVMVCLVGGAVSIGLTFLLEALTGITAVELAGVIEEPAKGAVLLALAFVPRFRGILRGLALGVCVGAGFAVIETVMYAYKFGDGGLPSTEVLLLRGVLSPFAHMAWTGALGGALWSARSNPAHVGVAVAVLGGMIVSHCLWNTCGPITYLLLALWALIFHYVRRGAAEAAQWGFCPKGV